MNSTRSLSPDPSTDPDLIEAVGAWAPRDGALPEVALEPRPDGLRVKLVYLNVETGVLFPRGVPVSRATVHATLDRVFGVLSWRVLSPPA